LKSVVIEIFIDYECLKKLRAQLLLFEFVFLK
jgi:hypothetical protein